MPGPIYDLTEPPPPEWPHGTGPEGIRRWQEYMMRRNAERAMEPGAEALPAPPPLVPAYPGIETWEDREMLPPVLPSTPPAPLPQPGPPEGEAIPLALLLQSLPPVAMPSRAPAPPPPPSPMFRRSRR